jgi:hypothetical protein
MNRLAAVAGACALAAMLAGCLQDEPVGPIEEIDPSSVEKGGMGNGELKVMTWNVYVGADVDVVLAASNPDDVPGLVAVAYAQLQATNFPERARAIAAQVARYRPHLIGLQEMSLIELVDPATFAVVEKTDFEKILMAALRARGLRYRVAGRVENADVTVPRLAGIVEGAPIIDYVRLLDMDAVLVREDVRISSSTSGRYLAALPVPDLGVEIPRGYVSVVADVGGRRVRFVTTHLESAAEEVRLPQAQELAAILAAETLPTIAVGDFNTLDPAAPNPLNDGTYQYLTSDGGFADAWLLRRGHDGDPGFTSPHDPDLRNPAAHLVERIDLVLLRNFSPRGDRFCPTTVHAEVIGEEEPDRTSTGMWPSDHAGVVVKLNGKIER